MGGGGNLANGLALLLCVVVVVLLGWGDGAGSCGVGSVGPGRLVDGTGPSVEGSEING